jgi:hypothetical protein
MAVAKSRSNGWRKLNESLKAQWRKYESVMSSMAISGGGIEIVAKMAMA